MSRTVIVLVVALGLSILPSPALAQTNPEGTTNELLSNSLGSIDDTYRPAHPWFNDDIVGRGLNALGGFLRDQVVSPFWSGLVQEDPACLLLTLALVAGAVALLLRVKNRESLITIFFLLGIVGALAAFGGKQQREKDLPAVEAARLAWQLAPPGSSEAVMRKDAYRAAELKLKEHTVLLGLGLGLAGCSVLFFLYLTALQAHAGRSGS
jgi:hypothetical protein